MDQDENKKEFKPAVNYFPIPDVTFDSPKEENVTTTRKYSVIIPKAEREDFMLEVRASQINEIREICQGVADEQFPYPEVILFLGSVILGVIACAIFSDLKLTDTWGKIDFIALPLVCVALAVTYLFLRKNNIKDLSSVAKEILKKLPNPNEETK